MISEKADEGHVGWVCENKRRDLDVSFLGRNFLLGPQCRRNPLNTAAGSPGAHPLVPQKPRVPGCAEKGMTRAW